MVFLKECDLEYKLSEPSTQPTQPTIQVDMSHPLYQKQIVMTKVRDQEIIEKLKQVGGILEDSISKTTFVLITKSKDDISNKTKYANEHGILIMTPAEFKETYF
jgi:NAD-dependent DNA ligase